MAAGGVPLLPVACKLMRLCEPMRHWLAREVALKEVVAAWNCSCVSAAAALMPLLLPLAPAAAHLPCCLLLPACLQAAQLDPKAPLPKLGLAQISVLAGEPTNAASILESVLLEAPQWIDALEVCVLVL